MTYFREGHWRTSSRGNIHWVEGHSVDRFDWTGGGGFSSTSHSIPASIFGGWRTYEAGDLKSYTIPNAHCPVCNASVFFYQSENGGRVFFDPPLGPPWPKHPCTDNNSPANNRRVDSRGTKAPPLNPRRLTMASSRLELIHNKALKLLKESEWRPLLDVRVKKLGKWWKIEGFDPIDNHRCNLVVDTKMAEYQPTYIKVRGPQRIVCEIEQPYINKRGDLKILAGRGWFGVDTLAGALVAKKARAGDQDAMREYARSRSYRYLGKDNTIKDVSDFVDLKAARFWFDRAEKAGNAEASLEHAYLLDLIASELTGAGGQASSRSAKLPGTAHVGMVCRKVKERLQASASLYQSREFRGGNSLDSHYFMQMEAIENKLLETGKSRLTPRLNNAIQKFVSAARSERQSLQRESGSS